jgi:hypothetical protein
LSPHRGIIAMGFAPDALPGGHGPPGNEARLVHVAEQFPMCRHPDEECRRTNWSMTVGRQLDSRTCAGVPSRGNTDIALS